MSSAKCCPFRLGLDALTQWGLLTYNRQVDGIPDITRHPGNGSRTVLKLVSPPLLPTTTDVNKRTDVRSIIHLSFLGKRIPDIWLVNDPTLKRSWMRSWTRSSWQQWLAVCARTRHIERDIIQSCREIISTNHSTDSMSRSNWIMTRSNWIMSRSNWIISRPIWIMSRYNFNQSQHKLFVAVKL